MHSIVAIYHCSKAAMQIWCLSTDRLTQRRSKSRYKPPRLEKLLLLPPEWRLAASSVFGYYMIRNTKSREFVKDNTQIIQWQVHLWFECFLNELVFSPSQISVPPSTNNLSSANILRVLRSLWLQVFTKIQPLNSLAQSWLFPSTLSSTFNWLFALVDFHSLIHLIRILVWFQLIFFRRHIRHHPHLNYASLPIMQLSW